jgi:hypothetical protein
MDNYFAERKLWWPVSSELLANYCDGSHTKEWVGSLLWLQNDVYHRDGDKPAYISSNGTLIWYTNGLPHRLAGPAVIYPDKKKEYWINGNNITKDVNAWLKTCQYEYPFTPEQQVEFVLTFS